MKSVSTSPGNLCTHNLITSFSRQCHSHVIGFRISGVQLEVSTTLTTQLYEYLPLDETLQRPPWLPPTPVAMASSPMATRRYTLDGHFEGLRLIFEAACGARLEYEMANAHCSASPLPHFSPTRSPPLLNQRKTGASKGKYNLWKNSMDTIDWFRKIKDKKRFTFVQFDIIVFYPSITK